MTVAPWAFGIDRASVEQATVDLCELVMTQAIDPAFLRSKIAIVDQGAGRPFKPRPCITIMISSPIGSPRAGENARYWPTEEQWSIQFASSADDTYTVTVLGVPYQVIAVGLGVTALRDAMLASMGVNVAWVATPVDADSIQVVSLVSGDRLLLSATPGTVSATRDIRNYYKRGFLPALLQVNIQCWGLLGIEDPSAVQGGPSIAENIRGAFLDTELTQPLRDCWFSPITARVLDGGSVVNQQTNSDATCQVVMRATSRLDVQTGSGTQITTTPTILGG